MKGKIDGIAFGVTTEGSLSFLFFLFFSLN